MTTTRTFVVAIAVCMLITSGVRAEQPAPEAPLNPYTPPACTGVFTDVACPGGFAVTWIEKFYADGITGGCSAAPLQYCPDATVTRAQMAVFVEKAMRGTGPWTPGDLGNSNTGLGAGSILYTATGASNTAVGAASLAADTTGANNTAVGEGSLQANTTAGRNTAVGQGALQLQSYNPGAPWAAYNTAVGALALNANQPNGGVNGTGNTAVGDSSLLANTTGFWNTGIGEDALKATTTGYDNTALGWKAGARAGDSITGYGGSTVVLVSNTTGLSNTFLGITGATTQVDNCTAVGTDAYCDASNEVRLGSAGVTSIGGKVAWSALSDARAKSDVRDLDLGLDFVLALRPVSFRYNGGNGRTDMGFVAQDVEALLGDGYNVLGIGGDADRTLSLRYTDLIAPMVKAIQDQQAQLAAKDARIVALETDLRDLRVQVQALIAAQRPGDGRVER